MWANKAGKSLLGPAALAGVVPTGRNHNEASSHRSRRLAARLETIPNCILPEHC
jgi:hypothetical protein